MVCGSKKIHASRCQTRLRELIVRDVLRCEAFMIRRKNAALLWGGGAYLFKIPQRHWS